MIPAAAPAWVATALILMSALLHSILHSLLKAADDKHVARLLWGAVYLSVMVPAVLFLPLPQGRVWLVLAASAVMQFLYQIANLNAYRHGDLTQTYPLMRGLSPGLTALGAALWFREALAWQEMVGIAVLTGGILLLLLERNEPALAGDSRGKGTLYAALGGVTIALYTLIDAYGVRLTPDPFTYIAWFFIGNSLLLMVGRPLANLRRLRGASRRDVRLGVAGGLVALVGYALALIAQRLGKTADIAALRETSIAFAVLIGFFILREKVGPQRWLAAAFIALGAAGMHLR